MATATLPAAAAVLVSIGTGFTAFDRAAAATASVAAGKQDVAGR